VAAETRGAGGAGTLRRGEHAAGTRGWLAMSARFLTRSLRLRATTHVFALLAITTGAAVAATMLTLRADLGAKMSRELRRYGPNLILAASPDRVPPTLDESAVRSAGIPGAAPMLVAAGVLAGPDGGRSASAGVIGADLTALAALNPSWRVRGAWPGAATPGAVATLAALASPGAVATPAAAAATDTGAAAGSPTGALVGAALAMRAGLEPGARATLTLTSATLPLTVTGVVSSGEAEDDEVFVPLAALQAATGLQGRVSLAAFAVDGGVAAVERAASRLERAVPGSSARPLRPIAAAQGAVLARLQRMMLLLTLVVLILSGLCLATTLMAMVVERESEIGLLRAMGAGDRDVVRMVVGEVTLLGVIGALLGVGLGAAGARLIGTSLFGAAIDPRAGVVPWVLVIALVVCWASVLVPLRRALAIRPALALRAE
jgi:putative ABC transport system permease protein